MQGDVVELVDISGNSVVKYKYDAWGNIIYQTPNQPLGDINPFRYRSYYYDIETGWYYLQSRYYNPSIGRFISADGLVGKMGDVQSLNMYAYCANNPVKRTDPSGKFFLAILGTMAVGALVGAIAGGVVAIVNGDDFWAGVAGGAVSGAICTLGVAVAVATGGIGGFAIAAAIGFAGGASGDIMSQGIEKGWDNIDPIEAMKVGAITALASVATFGLTSFIASMSTTGFEQVVNKSINIGSRIVQSLTPSFESIFIALGVGFPFSIATSEATSVIANNNGEIYIDAIAG